MAGEQHSGKSMRSHLAEARGLGSAKEGVGHWWAQRVTAIALVPLSLWFVTAILCRIGADYLVVKDWLSRPLTLTLMALFLVALGYHAVLGVQVVIEDYVHSKSVRLVSLLVVQFVAALVVVAGLVAMLTIAFAS